MRDEARGDLHVELQAIGPGTDTERLVLIGIVARQTHRALGQREGVAVPVHAGQRRRRRPEHGVCESRSGQVDLPDTQLWPAARPRRRRRARRRVAGHRGTRPGRGGRRRWRCATTRARARARRSASCTPIGPPITTSPAMSRTSVGGGTGSSRSIRTMTSSAPDSRTAVATDPGPSNATCWTSTQGLPAATVPSGNAGDAEQLGGGARGSPASSPGAVTCGTHALRRCPRDRASGSCGT